MNDDDYEVNKLNDVVKFVEVELMFDSLNLYYDDDDDDDDLFEIYEYFVVVVNNSMDYHLLNDQENVNLDSIFHEKISNKNKIK